MADRDKIAALSKTTSNLLRASDAWRGSSFVKYFAAKQMPELSDEQAQMRLTILRMAGQLVETEFEEAMDALVESWQEYRGSK